MSEDNILYLLVPQFKNSQTILYLVGNEHAKAMAESGDGLTLDGAAFTDREIMRHPTRHTVISRRCCTVCFVTDEG